MLQRSRSDADFSKRTLSEDAQMERLSDSGLNYGRDDGPMDHLDVMNSDRSRASTDEIHEKHDYEDSCASSGVSASSATSVMSVAGDEAIRRLEEELKMTRLALLEKEERCSRLSSMQTTVDTEVHELTEKLFQEAYKMVNLAEERKEKAEKLLKESRMKANVLQAEVEALKLLVSTPGAGGQHHTNHTSGKGKPSVFSKLLNNSSTPSHHKKSWQNDGNVPMSKKSQSLPTTIREQQERAIDEAENTEEIDPVFYREFVEWRDAGHPLSWPSDSSSTPTTSNAPSQNNNNFICRIQREEVDPCMSFDNTELATSLITAIRGNCIEIEPVNEEKPSVRNCALTAVPRFCPFRARASPDDEWHFISVLSRNRIAAVCDFHTYLRYVSLGIVRSGIRDTYFDVIALRKNMALARLGLGFIPKTTDQRNC
ncbi:unnamed protein product, partial [Mesorhabditis belari]|uniref:Uncharacterized protein n=1 Tax=Mesorhabditis belari TaxID=2138241 RepID=A0AAF3EN94_9BILA